MARSQRLLSARLIQIVRLYQSNSSGVAYTAHDCGVVAWLHVRNNRRLACRTWYVAAVLNVADLVAGDHTTQDRRLPVIIGRNQCSALVVYFQSRISQSIGDSVLRKLGTNRTNDYSLCSSPLNNKTTNHHMLARLNKAAGADVTKACLT